MTQLLSAAFDYTVAEATRLKSASGRARGAVILLVDEAELEQRVVERYLHAHGPAQLEDLVWWTGMTKTAIRRGIAALGEDIVEWMKENVHPLDIVFRLAEDHGIVLLNGSGFAAPDWSVRISFARGMSSSSMSDLRIDLGWKKSPCARSCGASSKPCLLPSIPSLALAKSRPIFSRIKG